MFVQSKLSIMQKAQTFTSCARLLTLIDLLGDKILEIQRQIWGLEVKKPKTLKVFYKFMTMIGLVFADVKLVLASNLNALEQDGRITL